MGCHRNTTLPLIFTLGTITLFVQGCKGADSDSGDEAQVSAQPTPPLLAEGTAPLEVHAYISGAMSNADLLVLSELTAGAEKLAELEVRTVVHVVPISEQAGVEIVDLGTGPFAVEIEDALSSHDFTSHRQGLPRTVIQTREGDTRKSYEEASQGQTERMIADLQRYLEEDPTSRPKPEHGGATL